mmetsp:Transcript_11048/g.31031  ORF Transcript_11048/g.31031 Transcript_11048/m.31031 type:complete len:122 (+) Transcript_11048:1-366(+)
MLKEITDIYYWPNAALSLVMLERIIRKAFAYTDLAILAVNRQTLTPSIFFKNVHQTGKPRIIYGARIINGTTCSNGMAETNDWSVVSNSPTPARSLHEGIGFYFQRDVFGLVFNPTLVGGR